MKIVLRPYPEYKNSSIPRLERIPKHWDCKRIKNIFQELDERNVNGEGTLLSLTRTHGLIPQTEATSRLASAEDLSKYKICRPGQLVMNRMQAWSGMFAVPVQTGLISPDYSVFRVHSAFEVRYFEYLFKTPLYIDQFARCSKGIGSGFNRLYTPDFGAIPVGAPPGEDQKQIVAFNAHFERRINKLVRNKRRLIELLNEQKHAIIHRAVTRGLDPNVCLKPSGIDWLGDVPEHWEIAALGTRYWIQLGKMLDAKRITGNHLVPYLRNIDVQWDRINSEDLPRMDIPEPEYERYLVRRGDLLVCEGGDVGRSAFWDEALSMCGYQKALHRLRPRSDGRDHSRFVFYALFAASKRGIFVANGSENTIAHLTAEKLRRHRFPFPPRVEQETIARYLDATLGKLEQAGERANREVSLLREYRTRLISDVVTGKLDVRGVELSVQDEAELPAGLDIPDGSEKEEMADIQEEAI